MPPAQAVVRRAADAAVPEAEPWRCPTSPTCADRRATTAKQHHPNGTNALLRNANSGALPGEVHQRGTHAPTDVALVAEIKRREDGAHVTLDCPLRDDEALGDCGVAPPFGDQPENLELPRCQAPEPRALPSPISREELFDDPRVDDRASDGDFANRPVEVPRMTDALLQQIGA